MACLRQFLRLSESCRTKLSAAPKSRPVRLSPLKKKITTGTPSIRNETDISRVECQISVGSEGSSLRRDDGTVPPSARPHWPSSSSVDEGGKTFSEIARIVQDKPNLSFGHVFKIIKKLKQFHYQAISSKKCWELSSSNTLEMKNSFLKTEALDKIYREIEKHLPTLLPNHLIQVLDVISLYGFPENENFFKKLIHMIFVKFDTFDTANVLHLYKVIHQFTVRNDDLKLLKLACLEHMLHNFDEKGSLHDKMAAVCYYASKKVIPMFIRKKLFDRALTFDWSLAPSISFAHFGAALLDRDLTSDLTPDHPNLKEYLSLLMASLDDSWSPSTLIEVTRIYCHACSMHKLPYQEYHMDKIAEIAMQGNHSYASLVYINKNLLANGHLNVNLLNKLVRDFCHNEDVVRDMKAKTALDLVMGLGTADVGTFPGINWDFCKNKLESLIEILHSSKAMPRGSHSFLAMNLAVLGVNDYEMLREAVDYFNKQTFQNLVVDGTGGIYRHWVHLLLNMYVSVLHPSYSGVRPIEHLLKETFNLVKSRVQARLWEKAVVDACGGENFVLTDCTTPLFHVLSYVVIFDENNRTIDVSSYKSTDSTSFDISKLPINADHRILILLDFTQWMTTLKNMPRFVGFYRLYTKILNAMGYNVVSLTQTNFNEMTDDERVFYVKKLVENVCGSPNKTF